MRIRDFFVRKHVHDRFLKSINDENRGIYSIVVGENLLCSYSPIELDRIVATYAHRNRPFTHLEFRNWCLTREERVSAHARPCKVRAKKTVPMNADWLTSLRATAQNYRASIRILSICCFCRGEPFQKADLRQSWRFNLIS